MVLDYAKAWHELRTLVASKPSHGRHELLVAMAQLEAAHEVSEDELERVIRVYGPQLYEGLVNRLPAVGGATAEPEATEAGCSTEPVPDVQPVRPSIAA